MGTTFTTGRRTPQVWFLVWVSMGLAATTAHAQVELQPDLVIPFGSVNNLDVALSPDGSLIVASTTWYAVLFDAETGDSLRSFGESTVNYEFHGIAWSPAGDRIVTTSQRRTTVWNVDPLEEIVLLGADSMAHEYANAWSSDGRWVATGNRFGRAFVWDAATGELVFRHDFGQTENAIVLDLQFFDDDTRLFVAMGNGYFHIWNLEEDELEISALSERDARFRYGTTGDIDPKSMIVATTSGASNRNRDGTITLWDARTGDSIGALEGLVTTASEIEFSQNGEYVAATDTEKHALIWRMADRSVVAALGDHPESVYDLVIDSDYGRIVALGGDSAIRVYNYDLSSAPGEPVAGEGMLALRTPTPNPAMNETTLDFTLAQAATVSVRIIDVSGLTLLQIPPMRFDAGAQRTALNVEALPSGTYLCLLTAGHEHAVTELQIVR